MQMKKKDICAIVKIKVQLGVNMEIYFKSGYKLGYKQGIIVYYKKLNQSIPIFIDYLNIINHNSNQISRKLIILQIMNWLSNLSNLLIKVI